MSDMSVLELRRAQASDDDFVVELYRSTMQPLLVRLNAWDERDVLSRFRRYFKLRETRIIGFAGQDVGFFQVSETRKEFVLAQIHITAPFRGRGIGTQLVQGLLREAAAKRKPVLLSVVRGNRAQELYERLGFLVTGQDATRFHLRWDASAGRAPPASA